MGKSFQQARPQRKTHQRCGRRIQMCERSTGSQDLNLQRDSTVHKTGHSKHRRGCGGTGGGNIKR